VVNGREIHHVQLPPAAEIEALAREYKDAIERRLADPLRTRIPAAERLYQLLIAPLRAWIPAGSRVRLRRPPPGPIWKRCLSRRRSLSRTALLDRR
jgi:hypothetical protein